MATTTTHRVELPDGNTQTRKSKTRRYEAAVLARHTEPVPAHWGGAWAILSWHTTYKLAAAKAERVRGYRYCGEGRKIYADVSVVELVECDSCAELVDTDDTGPHGECVTCTRCAERMRAAYMHNGATSLGPTN